MILIIIIIGMNVYLLNQIPVDQKPLEWRKSPTGFARTAPPARWITVLLVGWKWACLPAGAEQKLFINSWSKHRNIKPSFLQFRVSQTFFPLNFCAFGAAAPCATMPSRPVPTFCICACGVHTAHTAGSHTAASDLQLFAPRRFSGTNFCGCQEERQTAFLQESNHNPLSLFNFILKNLIYFYLEHHV